MRLVTVRTSEGTRAGRLEGDDVVLLDAPDVHAVLDEPALRHADGERISYDPAALAPVIPAPRKIFCLGLNYESHIREMGRELPSHPTLFAKFARCLIGARDPIVLPRESTQVDWEVELAVVIGQSVRRASQQQARDAIAGYTICNDVSMRDWQFRSLQFLQGKTWENSTPLGPALVTLDELADPADLAVRCEVNGEVMQDSRTSDLIWGPVELIRYISTIVTLEPGDVISTGTPGGVGHARDPQVFLQPGDVVRTVVEGVGELLNECVAESGPRQ